MTRPAGILRPYRPEDRDALFDVCVRTGHEGGDSRHLYPDPDLLPNIFAAPYVALEPELAFVVEDGGRAVGYILGTADTASFVARYRAEWLPGLTSRYPAPVQPQDPATPAEMMTGLMHDPERMVLPELDNYPAHLHIDLLPSHQRYGYGRALMETFLGALHRQGVPAVHLSMLTSNTAARAFYDRVGFHEIAVPDPGPVTCLGRSTAATPPR
ncbi:GNAT family N-acetyltransferase [Streptomyces microflavus]|uniref:GNAT family N-acetyltransferase n=1 Tax=Streptomyces microflavus TaxID=1919 RepID=UPI0029BBEDDD|nr:GNAT family N-acetyltransferase [Streptomyces microflavus]MDX2403036.1 GNAT family N-acetyltransferase [Streptomyces microflavus]